MDPILEAVKVAHEAQVFMGIKRIESNLRIDDRRDKPRTMRDKVDAIKRYIDEAQGGRNLLSFLERRR